MTGRVDKAGEPLPSALLTEHLRFSLPYRSLFSHGLSADNLPSLVDALVVLLVRLHLAGFFWGDVSLSNVLFRRSAGGFAAYLVDAETGEFKPSLSAQLRQYDLTIATENVFGELLDLQASETVGYEVEAHDIVELLEERYHALWGELTAEEEFSADELWRIEQRIERLNDLGFDVDELDIITDFDGDTDPDPAQGRRARPPPARAAGADRAARGGPPGAAAAQRPGVVHRVASTSAGRTGPWSPTAGSPRSTSRSRRWCPPRRAASSSPRRSSTRSSSTAGSCPSRAAPRWTRSRPPRTTSPTCSAPSRTRRWRPRW